MSQLILAKGNNYRKSIFQTFFPKFEPGFGFLTVSLIVFVSLITVITLMFSAKQVTKGYMLNSLEAQHSELVKASEISDMRISQVRSLTKIEDSAQVARMVVPREVVFIDGNTAIASR